MVRLVAATPLIASFAAAPAAVADSRRLAPVCNAGSAAQAGACAVIAEVIAEDLSIEGGAVFPGFFPGANPSMPPGPLPFNFPVVLPLGVTPFNVPPNLPLGPTPPTRLPFAPG